MLLHGGPGLDHHVLLPLAIPLAGSFEVLVPDLPGHGRSHTDRRGLPNLTQVIERTAHWVANLDPPAAVIGGHSLGAIIADELIRQLHIVPQASVLLSPPSGSRHNGGSGPARLRPPLRRHPRLPTSPRALRRELLAYCTDDAAGTLSPEMEQAVRMANLRPPDAYTALLGQLRRRLDGPGLRHPATWPILVLWGEHDPMGSPADEVRIAQGTGSRTVVLPETGHFPFATRPACTVNTILTFLADCGLVAKPHVPK